MQTIIPWIELIALIEPFYPAGEGRGRPLGRLEHMLRMYIAQQYFGLSDEGMEDAIYDSQAVRGFVSIALNREAAPEPTTLLKFQRLLETHQLTSGIFDTINRLRQQKGLLLKGGSIVDATLIAAPTSTKNSKGERDPDMHSTRKGNQWYFEMKAYIGVDVESGIVHTLVTTAASVRAKVEHPFHLIKDIFGLKKVRYKGLFKNTVQLCTLFVLANLLIAKRYAGRMAS